MSVTLSPEAETRVRNWIERGHYPDAEAVIDQALHALEEQAQTRFLKARALVLAGLNSGEAVELTDELWDEMEREAEEAFRRGEEPPPHVCP